MPTCRYCLQVRCRSSSGPPASATHARHMTSAIASRAASVANWPRRLKKNLSPPTNRASGRSRPRSERRIDLAGGGGIERLICSPSARRPSSPPSPDPRAPHRAPVTPRASKARIPATPRARRLRVPATPGPGLAYSRGSSYSQGWVTRRAPTQATGATRYRVPLRIREGIQNPTSERVRLTFSGQPHPFVVSTRPVAPSAMPSDGPGSLAWGGVRARQPALR